MSETQRMVSLWVDHRGEGSTLNHFWLDTSALRMAIYAVNNSLSDAVVVWRCIVVWQRDWRACTLPILLLAATTGNGLYFASLFKDLGSDAPTHAERIRSNGIAFFALSLATNSITTSLVAGRIWWLAHKVFTPGLSTGRYNAVVAMLVESGLVYSTIKVAELVLYTLNSPAVFIVFYSMAQIMCITPTAIFIFVALGIVDSGVPQPTIDPGRSFMDRGIITGASFQFARPTATATFGRTNTVGSVGVNFSIPVVKRDGDVDFKGYGGHMSVVSTLPEETCPGDLSEKSSIEEHSDSSFLANDLEKQLERTQRA
ncbi:hypothetical protein FRB90_003731 [Tulasnella sp. 427]|nr:hypothetical protein FRB90_003731 [Tulasnella sp. 427]